MSWIVNLRKLAISGHQKSVNRDVSWSTGAEAVRSHDVTLGVDPPQPGPARTWKIDDRRDLLTAAQYKPMSQTVGVREDPGNVPRVIDALRSKCGGPRHIDGSEGEFLRWTWQMGLRLSADDSRQWAKCHERERYQHSDERDGKRDHPRHDGPPVSAQPVKVRAGIGTRSGSGPRY